MVVAVAAAIAVAPARASADEVSSARRKAEQAAAALSEAESRVGTIDSRIADLRAQREAATGAVAKLQSAVQEAAISQFIYSDLELAAGAGEEPNEQVKVRTLGEIATGSSRSLIEQYQRLVEEADASERQLNEELGRSRKAADELRRRRAAADEQVARLARAAEATRPRARAAAGTAPIASGAWVCPVQGPVAFSDSWGAPRSGGRSHTGVDMLSPRGTPTVAPVAGRVVHKESGLGGLTWYVYGDDGNTYYGAHLSSYENQGIGRCRPGRSSGTSATAETRRARTTSTSR